MKPGWILLLCVSFMALSAEATGGSEAGNGGVGIRCQNSIELFDLYEGRILNGNIPIEKPEDYKKQALSFASHLSDMTDEGDRFDDLINHTIDQLKFLPSGVGLGPTGDLNNFIYPKNCEFVQILNYQSDGFIYVDSDLWAKLSETQKAAAILHETIYEYFRTPDYLAGQIVDGDQNSARTRRAVSHLIAGKKLQQVRNRQLANQAQASWLCKGQKQADGDHPSVNFDVYEFQGKTIIEFFLLNGRRMITNASLTLPWSFKQMNGFNRIQSIVDGDVSVDIQSLSSQENRNEFVMQTIIGNQRIQEPLDCWKTEGSKK